MIPLVGPSDRKMSSTELDKLYLYLLSEKFQLQSKFYRNFTEILQLQSKFILQRQILGGVLSIVGGEDQHNFHLCVQLRHIPAAQKARSMGRFT